MMARETIHEKVQRMKKLGGQADTMYGRKNPRAIKSGKKRPGFFARMTKAINPRAQLLELLKARRKSKSIAESAEAAKKQMGKKLRRARRQASRG